MAIFPSDEWLRIYRDRINGSAEYREAAATWEGAIAFVFEAEPDGGIPEDLWCPVTEIWRRIGPSETTSPPSR